MVDKYNKESAQVYWESIFQETNPIWTQNTYCDKNSSIVIHKIKKNKKNPQLLIHIFFRDFFQVYFILFYLFIIIIIIFF